MNLNESSDTAIQSALGARLRDARLDLNMTRANLAANIGVSVDTVRNAETGRNVSTETLIRLLRGPSPVRLARRQGKIRRRASGSRDKQESGRWQW